MTSHAQDELAHHHFQQALACIKAQQPTEALKHFRVALNAKPDFVEAHFSLGLFLLQLQRLTEAAVQFKNVLTLWPHHLQATFYTGIIALQQEALDQAETAFNEILIQNPEDIESLVNLGVVALKRQEGQKAVDFFTRALAFDPSHRMARHNLAATFIHHDRFENALTHYQLLLEQSPHESEYLYNAGVAQMMLGHLNEAQALFSTLLIQDPSHFAGLNNLAAVYQRLGQREQAIELLTKAHQLAPDNAACAFMLNAMTQQDTHVASCPEYVTNLFNNYALYYESHMQQALKYQLPHRIAQIQHTLLPEKVNAALDLGCGTGLMGIILREGCHHLTGVDLSPKMLAHAREKGIYDVCDEDELIHWLETHFDQRFDLIVAADVLPYFGDLNVFFKRVSTCMMTEGLLIISCEISAQDDWLLQSTARFCHHPQYVESVAQQHGLTLVQTTCVVARQQANGTVSENVYVFKK